MNEYQIQRIHTAPDWSRIPVTEVANIAWVPDAGIRMWHQACYDENALYVHQRCQEKNIRAELTGDLDMICNDSCMEFFFSPYEDNLQYINIEVNPNGAIYLGLYENRSNGIRWVPTNAKVLLDIRTARTEDGWEVFYRVPLSLIRLANPTFTFQSGRVIPANCFKCGDMTPQRHYITWNPMSSEKPDYHRPQDFGRMILE